MYLCVCVCKKIKLDVSCVFLTLEETRCPYVHGACICENMAQRSVLQKLYVVLLFAWQVGTVRSSASQWQSGRLQSFFNVAQRWTIQYTCFHIHEIYIYCQLMELLVYSCLFEQCWICSLSAHGIPWILIQQKIPRK